MYKKFTILLCISSILLTGCWDQIEIDERAHISALGIDKYYDNEVVQSEETRTTPDKKIEIKTPENIPKNRYAFTFAFPDELHKNTKDIIISSVGETLYTVSEIIADRTNKAFFMGHLKTVIIGSEVAEDPIMFREILNALETEELISRKVVMAITKDTAHEILKIEPSTQPMVGQFVSELFRRTDRTPRTPKGDVGEIFTDLHETGTTIIPTLIPGMTDVKAAGAAVIKDYELKGWLGEIDTRALMILKRDVKISGGFSIKYKDHIVALEIRVMKPKKSLIKENDKITIVIDVPMKADVKQTYFNPRESLLDTKVLKDIEDITSKTVKEEMDSMIKKIQNEFGADVIGIGDFLDKYHHEEWEKLEENWDDVFPNINIEIKTSVKIRRIGLTW